MTYKNPLKNEAVFRSVMILAMNKVQIKPIMDKEIPMKIKFHFTVDIEN
jgi:hypothetical protein